MKNQATKQKRIKQVFKKSDELCEVFAKQCQDYGVYKSTYRSGGECTPIYFEGSKLFSYGSHYLLADFLDLNGHRIAMVNFEKYSSSTSGQSWEAFRALEKAGFKVVQVEGFTLNSSSGPLDILNAVNESLESKGFDLSEKLITMTYVPYNKWFIDDILKDIKEYNKLVSSLDLKNLVVKVCPESLLIARRLSKLDETARNARYKRKQERLFTPEYNSFIPRDRNEQKRVA